MALLAQQCMHMLRNKRHAATHFDNAIQRICVYVCKCECVHEEFFTVGLAHLRSRIMSYSALRTAKRQ